MDGTAVPDENGYFTYVPAELAIDQPNEPITILARVRVPDYSVRSPEFADDLLNTGWYANGYDFATNEWDQSIVDDWFDTIFATDGSGFNANDQWNNSSFTRDWDSLFADYATGFDYSVQFRLDPTATTTLTVGDWDRVDASNPYNSTVTGTVQPAAGQQANVATLTVEFYLGGTLDGSTTTDADGVFYYTLRTAQPGDNEVTVRIIEPQYGSETKRVTDVGVFSVLLEKDLNLHASPSTRTTPSPLVPMPCWCIIRAGAVYTAIPKRAQDLRRYTNCKMPKAIC